MKPTSFLSRAVAAFLVTVFLLSASVGTALAGGSAVDAENHASDITISGFDVALQDVHIVGEGLSDVNVEDRTYSIDERIVTIDSMTLTVNDTEIEVDGFSITAEDSTLAIRNVSIGEE